MSNKKTNQRQERLSPPWSLNGHIIGICIEKHGKMTWDVNMQLWMLLGMKWARGMPPFELLNSSCTGLALLLESLQRQMALAQGWDWTAVNNASNGPASLAVALLQKKSIQHLDSQHQHFYIYFQEKDIKNIKHIPLSKVHPPKSLEPHHPAIPPPSPAIPRQPDAGAAGARAAPAAALGGGLLRAPHRGERLGTDGAHRGLGGALVERWNQVIFEKGLGGWIMGTHPLQVYPDSTVCLVCEVSWNGSWWQFMLWWGEKPIFLVFIIFRALWGVCAEASCARTANQETCQIEPWTISRFVSCFLALGIYMFLPFSSKDSARPV